MATTVGFIKDGQKVTELDKAAVLKYLKVEQARAETKIRAGIPAEGSGLRDRYEACKKLHAQLSPLTDENIEEAGAAGKWRDEPFPIDLPTRLAALAAQEHIG